MLSSDYEVLRKAIYVLSIKIDKLNSSENDSIIISTASQQILNITNSPCSVANNLIKEFEDKEHRKNNLIFYNTYTRAVYPKLEN